MKTYNTTKKDSIQELLHPLIYSKVQIFYTGPDGQETSAQGRLLNVNQNTIKIQGAMTEILLIRKEITISSIDYLEHNYNASDMKIWIHSNRGLKISGTVLRKIGKLVDEGKTTGLDEPKGFDWELDVAKPIIHFKIGEKNEDSND